MPSNFNNQLMKLKSTLLLLILSGISFAQTRDFKLGKVTEQEKNIKEVFYDKNANAVILSEEGKMNLSSTNYYLTVKRRIKILTEKGKEEANIQLSYYSENKNESISGIKGNTINVVNGKEEITPIDEKEIFDVSINQLYNAKRFTFSNVQVGSIIEYTYTKSSEYNFSIDAWNFQHDIPTLFSEFKLNNQSYGGYSIITIGDEINTKYKGKTSSTTDWILTNQKSYNDLRYVYNQKDQSERIKLQHDSYHTGTTKSSVMNAWKDLIRDINSQYDTYRNPSAMRDIAKVIPDGATEIETLRNIVEYVNNNVKWNNIYSISPKKTNKSVLKDKVGMSSDLNLFLQEILTAKGLNSYLIIGSTRNHGQVLLSYPLINQFSSVITAVKLKSGQVILLDGAQLNKDQVEFAPLEIFNYYGVVIQKGEPSFVKLTQKLSDYESIINYQFLKDKVILHRQDRFNGYFYDQEADEENVLKRYVTESMDQRFDIENSDDLEYRDNKYKKSYKAVSKQVGSPFYNFVNPLRAFLSKYTFDDKNRQRKVEFEFPYFFNIQVKSKIPEGYEVVIDEKYKAHHKSELGLEYYQEAKLNDNVLTISYQFILPEGVYEAEKYNDLKQFFDKIREESNKEVLMKKK